MCKKVQFDEKDSTITTHIPADTTCHPTIKHLKYNHGNQNKPELPSGGFYTKSIQDWAKDIKQQIRLWKPQIVIHHENILQIVKVKVVIPKQYINRNTNNSKESDLKYKGQHPVQAEPNTKPTRQHDKHVDTYQAKRLHEKPQGTVNPLACLHFYIYRRST